MKKLVLAGLLLFSPVSLNAVSVPCSDKDYDTYKQCRIATSKMYLMSESIQRGRDPELFHETTKKELKETMETYNKCMQEFIPKKELMESCASRNFFENMD